jgi:hypothetical protein
MEKNIFILSEINDFELENKEFEVIRTGEFYDHRYGKFKVTEELLSELEENFNNDVLGIQLGIDIGHEPIKCAVAWIESVRKDGDRLLVKLKDFSEEGKKYLKEKIFKYFSI